MADKKSLFQLEGGIFSKEARANARFVRISSLALNPGAHPEVYIRSVKQSVVVVKDIFVYQPGRRVCRASPLTAPGVTTSQNPISLLHHFTLSATGLRLVRRTALAGL